MAERSDNYGIPADFCVRPLGPDDVAKDRVTCNTCGRSWDDAVPTAYTPAPSARCPFEYWHDAPEDERPTGPIADSEGLFQAVLASAKAHGEDSEPDHEVGDLQDFARRMWDCLTADAQRRVAQEMLDEEEFVFHEGAQAERIQAYLDAAPS